MEDFALMKIKEIYTFGEKKRNKSLESQNDFVEMFLKK